MEMVTFVRGGRRRHPQWVVSSGEQKAEERSLVPGGINHSLEKVQLSLEVILIGMVRLLEFVSSSDSSNCTLMLVAVQLFNRF